MKVSHLGPTSEELALLPGQMPLEPDLAATDRARRTTDRSLRPPSIEAPQDQIDAHPRIGIPAVEHVSIDSRGRSNALPDGTPLFAKFSLAGHHERANFLYPCGISGPQGRYPKEI